MIEDPVPVHGSFSSNRSRGPVLEGFGARGLTPLALVVMLVVAGMGVLLSRPPTAEAQAEATACPVDGEAAVVEGTVTAADEKTYRLIPVEVPEGVARVEVAYTWDPLDEAVFDLGLWDESGTSGPDGFRGWSGSRQGRIHEDQEPVVVSADTAERGYVPGPIEAGTWHVEVGVAAVPESGASYRLEVSCRSEAIQPEEPGPDPGRVDPDHVADPAPGWYMGDFHLHARHSNPEGPDGDAMVAHAVAAGLDIVAVTDYVTTQHWRELGPVQERHPDVLLWPGREVITYFGHAIVLGETPSTTEYRVGHDGITMATIQDASIGDDAIFGIAHPTLFPEATFGNTCRGCEYQLFDQTDLDQVTTMEVITGGALADLGGVEVPNPFVRTAIDQWEGLLGEGHRITAVSGADDKLGDRYGATSTAVWAEELSVDAAADALRRGHAYVRGLGQESPTAEFAGVGPDGETAMFGDTIAADTAQLTITVRDGDGQLLHVRRDGTEVEAVPVVGDEFVHTVTARRFDESGPLGTFWGFEVTTTEGDAELMTIVANPIFLADPATAATSTTTLPASTSTSATQAPPTSDPADGGVTSDDGADSDDVDLAVIAIVAVVLIAAGAVTAVGIRRTRLTRT